MKENEARSLADVFLSQARRRALLLTMLNSRDSLCFSSSVDSAVSNITKKTRTPDCQRSTRVNSFCSHVPGQRHYKRMFPSSPSSSSSPSACSLASRLPSASSILFFLFVRHYVLSDGIFCPSAAGTLVVTMKSKQRQKKPGETEPTGARRGSSDDPPAKACRVRVRIDRGGDG